MGIVEELYLFDRQNAWPDVFQKIKYESLEKHDYSLKESRKPENRGRNRYGDVNPYDHSRISLDKGHIDYINASLVKADQANRAYILTQGPLPDTIGHFWLMVWEQQCPAILMLNNMIEKGYIKCHQYFPTSESPSQGSMTFGEVNLKVTFVDELESNSTYVIRNFLLECTDSGESRQIFQFHYTAWPDFGVPESPSTFLEFLFVVRKYGFLDDPTKPPVIHCSAGIGRSGTFCLVDTCLILAEKQGGVEGVCVLDELMHMRQYRMGLIQTPEQLRFTYLAIIEGSSRLNCLSHSSKAGLLTENNNIGGLDEDDPDSMTSNSDFEGDDDDDDDNDVDAYSMITRSDDKVIRNTCDDDDSGHHNGGGGGGDDDDSGGDKDVESPPLLPRKKNDKNNNIVSMPDINSQHTTTHNTTYSTTHNDNNIVPNNNANTENNKINTTYNNLIEDSATHTSTSETSLSSDSLQNVEPIKAKHDERIKKMKETIERIKKNQRDCEIEREKGWFGWVRSPYVVGGVSVVVMVAAWVAYKMV